jgi:hypothetical protein
MHNGRQSDIIHSVVNLTLLHITSEAVIPEKAGIHFRNTGFPRIKYGAGLVKPGMTNKGKGFLTHHTRFENLSPIPMPLLLTHQVVLSLVRKVQAHASILLDTLSI